MNALCSFCSKDVGHAVYCSAACKMKKRRSVTTSNKISGDNAEPVTTSNETGNGSVYPVTLSNIPLENIGVIKVVREFDGSIWAGNDDIGWARVWGDPNYKGPVAHTGELLVRPLPSEPVASSEIMPEEDSEYTYDYSVNQDKEEKHAPKIPTYAVGYTKDGLPIPASGLLADMIELPKKGKKGKFTPEVSDGLALSYE